MNGSQLSIQSDLTSLKRGHYARGGDPKILTEIYDDAINIAIWESAISTKLASAVKTIMASSPNLQVSEVIAVTSAKDHLAKIVGEEDASAELREDIAELVEMFCCLFDLKRTGLRLAVLGRAMCPRFHVDHVPCRLLKTYAGAATQWIPHEFVDRAKLGVNSHNQPDEKSGLFQRETDLENIEPGHVAILKGERWEGNEGAGLVHRSPELNDGERRLFLSLDFCVG